MPKTLIDYSKTIIYKICCKDPTITDIYIGHTTNLTKRRNTHKANTLNPNNKDYNMFVYEFIRNNGGWNNWELIKFEDYNCNNKEEALKRERYWLEELKATLNKRIPFKTYEENLEYKKIACKKWQENNKERAKELSQKYNEKYKEEISERKKQKILCECGMTISYNSFNRHQSRKIHSKRMSI